MKLKSLVWIGSLVVALCAVSAGSALAWMKWQYSLSSDQFMQSQYSAHKAEFIAFASLLEKDKSVLGKVIESDGTVSLDGNNSRVVPDYRDHIRRIGAKFVFVREDGSIEFTLKGFGCAICSDSYMGVRYVPDAHGMSLHPGWTQQVVGSLQSKNLPQERGAVASGLYVVPIEPEWFIYRLEIQE